MSHPDPTQEYGQDNGKEPDLDDVEITPAEHWTKITELAKAIELGAQDLQDQLRDFNKSAV